MAEITISTAQDFADLMAGVYGRGASDDYLEVTLDSDIDMNDIADPYNLPSADSQNWYIHFDGNGHEIKNLYHSSNGPFYFFYRFYGYIRNLGIIDADINATHIYFLCGNTSAANSYMSEVGVSGNFQASANYVFIFQIGGTNSYIDRCSFDGDISTPYQMFVFSGATKNSGAYIGYAGTGTLTIYSAVATNCACIINNSRASSNTIYTSSNASYCYAVVYEATATCAMGSGASVLYANDLGSATFSGGTGESAANLINAEYMALTWGYPS